MTDKNTIPIVFDESQKRGAGTLGRFTPNYEGNIREIDVEKLKKSLGNFSEKLGEIFDDIKSVGNFRLTTAQLAVSINAEAGVSLVANAKAGASGTITLTFQAKD